MLIDLGIVNPGATIRIPFSTYDKDDGSSITATNFAVGDILVYKDGSTTQRASTSGFTATTDFDSADGLAGCHLAIIDLSDNTTADFWAAGSEYLVRLANLTVDGVTVGGWAARFRIGYQGAILDTTIATVNSQTSIVLATGPAEADALLGCHAIIHDAASGVQKARVLISAYGTSLAVTLAAAPTFTITAKDNISVFAGSPAVPPALPDAAAGLVTTTAFQARTLAAASYATASAVAAIAAIFTGITSLAQWLGLIAGKQVGNTTARTELRATGGGSGTYDETTDSQEALKDLLPASLEAAILNEGDATALLAAIAAKVEEFLINEGDATATIAAIATAVNSAVVAGTVGTNVAAVKAKTDNLPIDPADQSLIIDATNALATLIGDVPTNTEFAAALTALAQASDLATLQATATAVQKLLRADRLIDKTTDPAHWDEVLREEGTVTELVRRELFDVDGVALAAETTRIGRAIKP